MAKFFINYKHTTSKTSAKSQNHSPAAPNSDFDNRAKWAEEWGYTAEQVALT
jgi:hypothetical protein